LVVRHATLHSVYYRDLRHGGRAAARTHVQSGHAATRTGDQMKRKGAARKKFVMTLVPMI